MDGNGKQGQEGPSPEEKAELQIERADPSGLEEIRMFYHSLIDEMHRRGLPVTWKKDIYPNTAFLKQALEEGTLYTGRSAGRLVSVMVLNHRHSPEYEQGAWQETLGDSQVMVLHALGVHPDAGRRGIGRKMVAEALRIARAERAGALRLDVLRGNEPARKLYLACGFAECGSVTLFYENTGLQVFDLMEALL